jgi:acyl-CoA thioesterase-1
MMRSAHTLAVTSLVVALTACTNAPAPSSAPAPAQAATQSAQQLAAAERQRNDWPNLARYREANAALGAPAPGENRVVFMGNSITDAWAKRFSTDFPGKPYIGRGISGQTTPQMLVRFRQDVVALKPKVVVILAGINDIAGNTGPSTQAMIADNIMSMTEIAKANGIRVVLSSVLPAFDFPWHRGMEPAPKVIALNAWLKQYAQQAGVVYLDYHTRMADARGGLSPEMASDGVHPTPAGYQIMAPMAEAAIQEALQKPQ